MTGHLLVPALDPSALATVSAPITTGRLRDQLRFTGTVMTDALEMRAVSGTIGMVEGFLQAMIAGADAIESGALDYPALAQEIPVAVAHALDSGRLTLERLTDAARRTSELATRGDAAVGGDDHVLAGLGSRCIEVRGRLPRMSQPLVVECRPPGGMASGDLPWSLAEPLAALVPGTQTLTVTGGLTAGAIAERARDRTLVVVVRDPARHPWQEAVLEAAGAHGAAVVVDVGWPTIEPALPMLRTRGVSPTLLHAAAQILAGS
jgi:beta-N-acetylhexosaminidase